MIRARADYAVTLPKRGRWAIVLILLHLIITPCAAAMILPPADADCQHCHALNGQDACIVAAAASSSLIEGVAFNTSRADPKTSGHRLWVLLPADGLRDSQGSLTPGFRSRPISTRRSGDPPLFLLLGHLRN